MAKKSKRAQAIAALYDPMKAYSVEEAIEILKKCPAPKFDQSMEVSFKLGVDPRKNDQQVRGTVSLPHGTGKTLRVLVLAKGAKVQEAEAAGADYAGNDDLIEKIKGGWTEFDAVIATPDMMREVGKLGKVLGPRGLMPTPKAGTVTTDITKAVTEVKAGKIEFKVDKNAVINNAIGKLSFDNSKLQENFKALLQSLLKAKPASAKGSFVKTMFLSSTMGPGVKLDASIAATN